MKNSIFLLGFLISFVQLSFAQNAEVTSELKAYLITVDESGNETATEVSEVNPGDTIEYRLTYENNLSGGITNLTPVLPIPLEMEYQENTASPVINKASLTANEFDFQELPLTRQVTLPSGEVETQTVPFNEYRRLQWVVPSLDSGESVTLSARVKVIE